MASPSPRSSTLRIRKIIWALRMLRQAAEKTGDMVGDGTSTATILAHAIFADGIRNVVAGASAIEIKRGLDRATKRAIEALRALSRPVATRKERRRSARSLHTMAPQSVNSSPMQCRKLAVRGDHHGRRVENNKTTETVLGMVESMQFAAPWREGYLRSFTVCEEFVW